MPKVQINAAIGLLLLTLEFIIPILAQMDSGQNLDHDLTCNLSQSLIDEIKSYQPFANQIIDLVLRGQFKGRTYNELAKFVDKFPNRFTGGNGLEESIDYMMEKMRKDGIPKIWDESVEALHWTRGKEKAEILQPIQKNLRVLGLAPNPGTPEQGIMAEVIVVHNYTELEENKNLVPGKIIVYNAGWHGSYEESMAYRAGGAVPAAQYGAVAALVESVTPLSLDTPHTGGTIYSPNITRIPFASITREDAEMLSRIHARGENITIKLTLLDHHFPDKTVSRNSFGEIPGREQPDEKVAVSAHIDAWDVSQGAQDDGGGVVVSAEALAIIKHLGLTPRRSLQAIFWTAEEQGLQGVQSFVNDHRSDMIKYNAVFEADHGVFKPKGLDFAGTPEAGCIVQEVLKLLGEINATQFAQQELVGTDITYMIREGVPALSLMNENDKYFYYHHSPADTMSATNPDELDLCTAVWAVTSFVLADLSVPLPRGNGSRTDYLDQIVSKHI